MRHVAWWFTGVWCIAFSSCMQTVTDSYLEFECHVPHISKSCHTYPCIVSRDSLHMWWSSWLNHVWSSNESCPQYQRVSAHISMRHIAWLFMCGSWLTPHGVWGSWLIDMLSLKEACPAHQHVSASVSMCHIACLFMCVRRGSLLMYGVHDSFISWVWKRHVPHISTSQHTYQRVILCDSPSVWFVTHSACIRSITRWHVEFERGMSPISASLSTHIDASHCMTLYMCSAWLTPYERWGAGVEYHFQEI